MIQQFTYKESPITFEFENGNVMVNATEMAKAFNKMPSGFLRTKQTKEFIDAFCRSANLHSEAVVRVVNGGER